MFHFLALTAGVTVLAVMMDLAAVTVAARWLKLRITRLTADISTALKKCVEKSQNVV